MRNLVLVLGDQLDAASSAFDGFDRRRDAVVMAEVRAEAQAVWSSKPRLVMFLAAMRHFRGALRRKRRRVFYRTLNDPQNTGSLAAELADRVRTHRPDKVIVTQPGEHRVLTDLTAAARRLDVPLEVRTDRSFLCTPEQFAEHVAGRRQLRMEPFYRQMRRRLDVLIADDKPVGGQWNYDARNRGSFGRHGPGSVPPPRRFTPDRVTRGAIRAVESCLTDHPGRTADFDWPVTPAQAREGLDDFIAHRLGQFGTCQDAMWTDRPWLYHSRLSAAINLKLLDPRDVVAAAQAAYRDGRAPLASVEGFIRQIIGWREYVRGVYWQFMPEYLQRNALGADADLPAWYWTGRTDSHCLHQAIEQTLRYGYAHHIQRLMVTGLFALLLGVEPRQVHRWYLAVYVDAVEWVELPNTLGMSQFADGGVMASKPYAASGKYIRRMSNYCTDCPYDADEATGPRACPFTTLYWDFLMRHEKLLSRNARMGYQLRNLARLTASRRRAIRRAAGAIRASPDTFGA